MADARAFDQPSGVRGRSARATILLSFGLVTNLAAQMTFAATLHEIAADWALDASQSGWIGGIYFAGYAVSVPFLASATDRMDGRWLYVGSALLGAVASFAFAALAHGFVVALVLRFLGGVGLAGVHMPGLNLLMDRIDPPYHGRAAGIYTSSYAAGSAGSFLIDAAFGWRATFIAAGAGPLLSICSLGLLPASSVDDKSLAATAGGTIGIVLPLLVLVQITSFADVGALAGGAVAAADPAPRGAALALYALAGFTTGFLGPVAVGHALDWFDGAASASGWMTGYAVIAIGSAAAAWAVWYAPE